MGRGAGVRVLHIRGRGVGIGSNFEGAAPEHHRRAGLVGAKQCTRTAAVNPLFIAVKLAVKTGGRVGEEVQVYPT